MPAFHTMLSAQEIAAVVTYIRSAWENQAGSGRLWTGGAGLAAEWLSYGRGRG